LWKQFLPAALILAAYYATSQYQTYSHLRFLTLPEDLIAPASWDLALILAFLALPIFGTYAALRLKNLLAASVLTLVGVSLPGLFAVLTPGVFGKYDSSSPILSIALLGSYVAFAALACYLLRHSLSRRIYSF